MAPIRSSGPAVIPTRWLGAGAVILVHLAFLLALLFTDTLAIPHSPEAKPMTVYRLPDEPITQRPAPPIGASNRIASPQSLAAPRLEGPLFLVRPDKALPPGLPGPPGILDLSIHPSPMKSLDDLAPPSKEKQLKQFFAESEEANRLAREPSAGEDCQSMLAKDRDIGAMNGGYHDPVPMQTVCTPRNSAKELNKRNERFSPH